MTKPLLGLVMEDCLELTGAVGLSGSLMVKTLVYYSDGREFTSILSQPSCHYWVLDQDS